MKLCKRVSGKAVLKCYAEYISKTLKGKETTNPFKQLAGCKAIGNVEYSATGQPVGILVD